MGSQSIRLCTSYLLYFLEFKRSTDRDERFLEVKDTEANDGIRREFFLCLLWRRIHATDNGSIFIGRDFSGVKLYLAANSLTR